MAFEEIDFLPDSTARRTALADPDVGYYFQASADGTDWSNADAVITQITSDLFDGAHAEITSYSPLTATIRVKIVARDAGRLAAAGAVLTQVCRRAGVRSLSFSPSDAAITIFDVLVATQKLEFNDFDEVNGIPYPSRVYVLTLTCKPFPRSANSVTVVAPAPSGTITNTSIDTASSTTGWTTNARVISRTNLMPNPSFEYGVPRWVVGAGTTAIERVNDRLTTFNGGRGNYYLKVTPDKTSGVSYVKSPYMLATAGLPYAFSARLRSGGAAATTGGLVALWYDASGNRIGSIATYTTSTTITTSSSAMTTVSAVYTAPAGTAMMQVMPFLNQPGTASNVAWALDAVMVEQASTVGTYFDGDQGTDWLWSGTPGNSFSYQLASTTVTESAGKVQVSAYTGLALTRSGTINTASEKYLMVTGTITFPDQAGSRSITFTLDADNVSVGPGYLTYPQGSSTGGAFTAYFRINADSISTFTLGATYTGTTATGNITLAVDQVSTYSATPAIGTGRQSQRSVTAYGTMPAEADLTLSNGSNTLGADTIIYTKPTNLSTFTPPLRQYRTGGPTVTTSSSSISGATNTLTALAGADTYQIDVNAIQPSSYLLAAWLSGTGLTAGITTTFNWRASIIENGSLEHTVVTGSTVFTATGTTQAGSVMELGLMTLPPRSMSTTGSQSAMVQIQIWFTGSGTWTIDEAWLFDVDNGALSVLHTTDTINQIEIVPATSDSPQQRYLGTQAPSGGTITRDLSSQVLSWNPHRFDPAGAGTVDVFIMNNATTPAFTVTADYYPRWDMYAATVDQAS